MLSTTPSIMGIDPGLRGAIVIYDRETNTVINARNIPTLTVRRNKKDRRTLDVPTLVRVIGELHHEFPHLYAFLELVGANPMQGRRQGASSMFSFGEGYGALKTALVAAGVPFTTIPPSVWKKALVCPADKDASLAVANSLIPSGKPIWTPSRGNRTKEDCKGLAEAALIAFYGAHFRTPQILQRAA